MDFSFCIWLWYSTLNFAVTAEYLATQTLTKHFSCLKKEWKVCLF